MYRAYEWLCVGQEKVTGARYLCESQDSAVQRLFQIAIPSHFLTSAVAGTLIDTVGPKYTACFGQLLNLSSWILLSFASSSFNVYVFAFILMGAGADTGFLPTLHVANLFEGSSGLVVALMGAAASSSFAVPTVLDLIHSGGNISFQYICWGYAVIIVIAIFYAALFIPKQVFQPLENLNVVSSDQDENQVEPESSSGQWRASGEHLLGKSANTFFGFINPISFLPTIIFGKMVDSFGIGFVMAINTVFGVVSYVSGVLSLEVFKYISAIAMSLHPSEKMVGKSLYPAQLSMSNDSAAGEIEAKGNETAFTVSLSTEIISP
ncbi:transporter, major facilitator family protein [Cardiosporidium cionae]|uniref:Transporter, major facilitator family protein n=1 Tax=Cardiosporidium cionae TaxID=476202 RepID=A0ABQ7J5Z4_9APIC|nr:transporter, major facilitator family protein [Cardiosporidium cionae]|eukprot:KAF8819397.1 transporter, major facilitator family protein [Cardiosporidium cionae]